MHANIIRHHDAIIAHLLTQNAGCDFVGKGGRMVSVDLWEQDVCGHDDADAVVDGGLEGH